MSGRRNVCDHDVAKCLTLSCHHSLVTVAKMKAKHRFRGSVKPLRIFLISKGHTQRWDGRAMLNVKNDVFWHVTPRGSCKNRRFGGT
jgi:hypothetical protein